MISDKIGILWRNYAVNTLLLIVLTALFMPHSLMAQSEQNLKSGKEYSYREVVERNQNEQSRIIVKEKKKKRKNSKKKKSVPLLDSLNKHKNDTEVKHIKSLFTKLDELYSKVTIKVQKVGERDVLGPESITDLFTFLMECPP